jgi:Holliday junction resolvasome RuvABC endonuclease subunit
MNILALDLGTTTGWATNINGEVQCGAWKLATPKEVTIWGKARLTRRQDPRVDRLAIHLESFRDWAETIVFEDVQFASSTYQVQLWASLRAAVWLTFPRCRVIVDCVPVGTLKRFATGSGTASKEQMIAAAQKSLPGKAFGHDAADAFHLLRWAEKNLSRIKS